MTRAEKILWPILLALLLMAAYVHFVSASAADKNWLLVAARMWLGGKHLYSDIFEINPPLIVMLYAIPVAISEHVPFLTDYNALALMGFLATASVIALSMRIVAQHPAFAGDTHKQRLFAVMLTFVFVFFTAPMYFFDREHILLVMTFPYVLRLAPGLMHAERPLGQRLAVGALAALGFCIKPHAFLAFAVLQLLVILRERTLGVLFSVENLVIYGLAACYIAVILIGFPEYGHTVLPMAFATYSAYNRRANGIYSIIIFIVMLGMTLADFRKNQTPYRRDIYYMLGICGVYLVYALTNNGWGYTYNPLLSVMRLLTGLVLLEFLWLKQQALAQGVSPKRFIFGTRDCILTLTLNVLYFTVCFFASFLPLDCDAHLSCKSDRIFFEAAKRYPVHSFGAMSLEFYRWSELSRETGAHWDTRFNHLWMLPEFLISDDAFAERYRWITTYVGKAYAEDLTRRKPEIVFVDASPKFYGKVGDFDLPGYYAQVPEFREAWKAYRRDGTIDACLPALPGQPASTAVMTDCRFDLYRRVNAP